MGEQQSSIRVTSRVRARFLACLSFKPTCFLSAMVFPVKLHERGSFQIDVVEN